MHSIALARKTGFSMLRRCISLDGTRYVRAAKSWPRCTRLPFDPPFPSTYISRSFPPPLLSTPLYITQLLSLEATLFRDSRSNWRKEEGMNNSLARVPSTKIRFRHCGQNKEFYLPLCLFLSSSSIRRFCRFYIERNRWNLKEKNFKLSRNDGWWLLWIREWMIRDWNPVWLWS